MNLFKNIFDRKAKSRGTDTDEKVYYENLFIKNKRWNTAEPNEEESKRWEIIEDFLRYITTAHGSKSQPGKLKILDLGCGRGWLTNKLSAFGDASGIEPVEAVVKYGQTLFPHLDLKHGTAGDLLAKGNTGCFDVVVSSEVIEHIPDNEKSEFAKHVNLLLRDNGFAIITTPRKDIQQEWLRYCDPDQPVEDWIAEETLKDLFTSSGFVPVKLKRLSSAPKTAAPELEVYQLWLFQKK